MIPNGTARLQHGPWYDGKFVERVKLDANGNPPAAVWRRAKRERLMITAIEPLTGGIRWYDGKGRWK